MEFLRNRNLSRLTKSEVRSSRIPFDIAQKCGGQYHYEVEADTLQRKPFGPLFQPICKMSLGVPKFVEK